MEAINNYLHLSSTRNRLLSVYIFLNSKVILLCCTRELQRIPTKYTLNYESQSSILIVFYMVVPVSSDLLLSGRFFRHCVLTWSFPKNRKIWTEIGDRLPQVCQFHTSFSLGFFLYSKLIFNQSICDDFAATFALVQTYVFCLKCLAKRIRIEGVERF